MDKYVRPLAKQFLHVMYSGDGTLSVKLDIGKAICYVMDQATQVQKGAVADFSKKLVDSGKEMDIMFADLSVPAAGFSGHEPENAKSHIFNKCFGRWDDPFHVSPCDVDFGEMMTGMGTVADWIGVCTSARVPFADAWHYNQNGHQAVAKYLKNEMLPLVWSRHWQLLGHQNTPPIPDVPIGMRPLCRIPQTVLSLSRPYAAFFLSIFCWSKQTLALLSSDPRSTFRKPRGPGPSAARPFQSIR